MKRKPKRTLSVESDLESTVMFALGAKRTASVGAAAAPAEIKLDMFFGKK